MMNFIRSMIKTLSGIANRYYTADGRPDEKVKGKMYQHYGFRSHPPEGVELIHIEQGNAGISVAENDGNILTPSNNIPMDVGSVAMYTDSGNYINLIPAGTGSSVTVIRTPALYIVIPKPNDQDTQGITFIQEDGKISAIGSTAVVFKDIMSSNSWHLVNSKFFTDFCNHIHTGGTLPGALTGLPTYASAPAVPIIPSMLAGDMSQTLESD